MIKEADRAELVNSNRKKHAFSVDELRLLMALTRSRTEVTYGHSHWCYKHDRLVEHEHLDECECIASKDYKISEITKVLDGKDSIWELQHEHMVTLKQRLKTLNGNWSSYAPTKSTNE